MKAHQAKRMAKAANPANFSSKPDLPALASEWMKMTGVEYGSDEIYPNISAFRFYALAMYRSPR